jgi:hypothetical protein
LHRQRFPPLLRNEIYRAAVELAIVWARCRMGIEAAFRPCSTEENVNECDRWNPWAGRADPVEVAAGAGADGSEATRA